MSDQWFYARENRQQGPVSFDEVRRLAADGGLGPGDLVWTQSMSNWQPAGGVPGLFPAARAGHAPPGYVPAPPPLAPPPPGYPPAGYPPGQVPIGYANPVAPGYPPPGMVQDAGVRWLLPVGRSGWAIAAGYLGLLSVIPLFAPFALIVSIVAIRDIRRHPDRHGMGRAVFGLVMGVVFTIVGVIGLIAVASAPSRRY